MIEFEEPGGEYGLEKVKKKSIATKIRAVTLIIIFSLVIVFFAKNDFDFNFAKTQSVSVKIICQKDSEYSNRDYEELKIEKGQKALDQNLKAFQKMKGFNKGYIALEPIGYQGKRVPVIKLEFKGTVELDKKIPERICGFKVSVAYK